MEKTLYLIRGLPGSGKSTLAQQLAPLHNYAADMYFEDETGYNFDPKYRGEAHAWCRGITRSMMEAGVLKIAVHNTFTTHNEIYPYLEMADTFEYNLNVIHMENNFGSIHNVPDEVIERMKARWQPLR